MQMIALSDYSSAVRVTKNNLSTHINQFVDEEKATFEHFLMDKHTAFCFGGYYQKYTEYVSLIQ